MKFYPRNLNILSCVLGVLILVKYADASELCQGHFINPITDICWSCIFPMTLGNVPVYKGDNPDTENPNALLCACNDTMPARIGITLGFWEPVRLIDVTRHPYCFVNLGGKLLDMGAVGEGMVNSQGIGHSNSFYHVHYYIYPVIYWLNLITDALCMETQGLDLAYLTELDPLWNDDEWSFVLNPEAALFGNSTAQAACAADCAQATAQLANDKLFWCSGCQGSFYPLSGHVQAHIGGVQASTLLAERMIYKLHREKLLWGTSGSEGLCGNYPMPIMRKTQYRYQMTYPIPTTTSPQGCNPFGRSTTIWELGHEYPIEGEDFGYLIWRKRQCCAL